jgi:hypothetical protein
MSILMLEAHQKNINRIQTQPLKLFMSIPAAKKKMVDF